MKTSSTAPYNNLNGHYLQAVSYYIKSFYPDFYMGMHKHNQFEFMYAYKGDFYIELLENEQEESAETKIKTLQVKQGSFVFIDTNVFHRLRIHDNDVWIYNIELMPLRYTQMENNKITNILSVDYGNLFFNTHLKHLLNQGNALIAYPDTSNVDVSFKNFINAVSKPARSIEDRCHIESELLIFLTSIAKSIRMYSESNLSYIKQAILYIKRNLRSKITLEDVANHVNLNKIYLCNLFKKYTGKTVLQTINSLRISKGLQLLRDSNLPITAIPDLIGFSSHQQMFYEFKKFLGLSPTECRNAFLSDEVGFFDKHFPSYSIKINEEDFAFDDEIFFAMSYKEDIPNTRATLYKKIE